MSSGFAKYTFSFVALVLIGWVGYISWQQLERHERIQEEVARLEEEAEKIRRENETFSERISYFSSDAFREQEAKRKLGLKRANESVVVIKPAAGATLEAQTKTTSHDMAAPSDPETRFALPNYQKWQVLFFD